MPFSKDNNRNSKLKYINFIRINRKGYEEMTPETTSSSYFHRRTEVLKPDSPKDKLFQRIYNERKLLNLL